MKAGQNDCPPKIVTVKISFFLDHPAYIYSIAVFPPVILIMLIHTLHSPDIHTPFVFKFKIKYNQNKVDHSTICYLINKFNFF